MTPRREVWLPILLTAGIAIIALGVIPDESPPGRSASDAHSGPPAEAPGRVADSREPSAIGSAEPLHSESPEDGAPGDPGARPLVTGGILVGTATGDVGEPISGARIEIVARSGSVHSADAVSDAEGKYRFEGVPPGSYRLYASADRFIPVGWRGPEIVIEIAEGETQVRDVMISRGVEYRGRVLAGDIPIPGASICVRVADAADPAEPPRYEERFTSDDDGRFRAEGIPPGAIELTIECGRLEPVLVSAERVADLPAEILLWDAILLEAEVATSDGSEPPPLLRYSIHFQPDLPSPPSESSEDGSLLRVSEEDEGAMLATLVLDGTVSFGVFPPGRVRLEVRAVGFLDPPPVEIRLGPQTVESVVIDLVPELPFECDVRVFDRRGRPVPGATIRISDGWKGIRRTDASGIARIEGRGTPRMIEVQAEGFAVHRPERSPAGLARRLDIELRDEAVVVVRAKRADGNPFVGTCRLVPLVGEGRALDHLAGESMRFSRLAAGVYEVRVTAHDEEMFELISTVTQTVTQTVKRTVTAEEGRETLVEIVVP